nr:MAG TPA: hypothetical protein [Caudoviricetes sp.]
MIYLIDTDNVKFKIASKFNDIINIIGISNKDILIDFYNNFSISDNNQELLNIDYVNSFKSKYRNIFDIIMNISDTRIV